MTNSNANINWGIIGCGNVTEVKSGPAYQLTPGFNLQAVMRRDIKLAESYAIRHAVDDFYADADLLIESPDIDAVYIATPPDSHKHYALKVAKAGKPCCIEKPLSPNYQDSLAICQAFEARNIPLFVAYYRRSLARFNKVKALIDNAELGVIRHISWHLSKPASELDLTKETNWRTQKDVAVGGYFDDLASHGLDLFSYLLGDFKQVKGVAVNQQDLYSAFDSVAACWQHENDITGSGSWNFGGYSHLDKVKIVGDSGELKFSIFQDNPIELMNKNGVQKFSIQNPKHIQLDHVKNMRDYFFNQAPHPSTGSSALHTSWVMSQILAETKL